MTTAGLPDTAAFIEPAPAPPGAARPVSPRQADYLPTLDGWRALAILLVLLGHGIFSVLESAPALEQGAIGAFLRILGDQGRTGVNIFFGLSGFLICTRLQRHYAAHGRMDLRTFYIRRAHRILPAVLVFLTIIGLLGLIGWITLPLKDWLPALLFVANYEPEPTSWYVEHFWTLAMEEHFYLLFPVLVALVASPRRVLRVTIALAVAVAIWRAVDVTLGLSDPGSPWHRTDTACDGLLWGCVLAMLYDRPGWRNRLERWLNPMVFAALLLAFVLLAAHRPANKTQALLNLTAQVMVIPPLLLSTLAHPATWAGRALELSPLRWIGRLSFSLYLWQQFFLAWKGSRTPYVEAVQVFPVNVVCLFAVAAMSYYFVEKPLIRAGYRATKRS